MTASLGLVAIGMLVPPLLRRFGSRISARAVSGAHLAALSLMWIGMLTTAMIVSGHSHSLVEFCELALADRVPDGALTRVLPLLATGAWLVGRAVRVSWTTVRTTRTVRATLRALTTRRGPEADVARVGTVACTVGLLRPSIFIDDAAFSALPPQQRAAVMAHERSHVRGRHGLLTLAARAMAAGLAPLPSARLAERELRRHVEAMADDHAALRTSPMTVAATIVAAATTAPAATLGAGGWTTWRVERLLHPVPLHRPLTYACALPGVLSALVIVQATAHTARGVHLLPWAFPAG